MTAAGATAAPRRGAARRQMARGGSVPQLLGVVCCAVLVAAVSRAEAYSSTFVRVRNSASTSNPSGVCLSQTGGFLPNVFDESRNLEMVAIVILGEFEEKVHIPLSGTVGSSSCSNESNCIWQWRGGPLAAKPVTFYVGHTSNVKQDPAANLVYMWNTDAPINAAINRRATFFNDFQGWRNNKDSFAVTQFVCEVLSEASSTAPEDSSKPGKVTQQASTIQWWVGVIIVAGVAVVVIVIAVIVYCWSRKKSAGDSKENMELDGDDEDVGQGNTIYSRKSSGYAGNGDAGAYGDPSFGGGMGRQQSFGGGMQPQQSFGGGMPRQQSFGGGMPRQQSFGGGMGRQQSFGGGMQPQQSFGGGMQPQPSFGGGMQWQ